MRRGVLYIVFFLLLVSISYARASDNATNPSAPLTGITAGYAWLENVSLTHNPPLSDQALSIVALLGETGRAQTISTLAQKIKEQQDSAKSCWPKQGCTSKDSSLAVLALTKTGNTLDKELLALKKQLLATLRTGEWRIQIDAPSNGTCTVTANGQKKDFTLEGNSLTGASRKYYLHVAADLPGGSTLLATPNPKLTVDCTPLTGTVTLSLVYAKSNTELYIVQNFPNTAKADMTIQNTCFADHFDGTGCSYSATLETTWALTEAGQPLDQLGTLPYLYSALNNEDIQRAYLARILTLSSKTPTPLLDLLVKNQRSDGSWKGGDITATSLALLALQPSAGNYQSPVTNAHLFIEKKQSNDGSWKQTIKDTAFALLALKGDISGGSIILPPPRTATGIEICDNQIDDNKNGLVDCADVNACSKEKICHCENLEKDFDETQVDCGGLDCKACEQTKSSPETPQAEHIIPVKKSFGSCAADRDCTGSDTCINGKCAQKESGSSWIFILIVLLLLAGGSILFYLKYIATGKLDIRSIFSRKKKKPTFEEFKRMTEFQPIVHPSPAKTAQPAPSPRKSAPPSRSAKSKEDEALDASLKEAQRILQKK